MRRTRNGDQTKKCPEVDLGEKSVSRRRERSVMPNATERSR